MKKGYSVSFVIDARFNISVEANSKQEAYDIAKDKWNSFLINNYNQEGELEIVDTKLEHIENENGKYYYKEDLI